MAAAVRDRERLARANANGQGAVRCLLHDGYVRGTEVLDGYEAGDGRLGLVMGKTFAPRDPLWGTLTDVRRGHSDLFLRYSFQ